MPGDIYVEVNKPSIENDMVTEICNVIAKYTPFPLEDILHEWEYAHSLDVLLVGCTFAQHYGTTLHQGVQQLKIMTFANTHGGGGLSDILGKEAK